MTYAYLISWQEYIPEYKYWHTLGEAHPTRGVFDTYGFVGNRFQTMYWEESIQAGKWLRIFDEVTNRIVYEKRNGVSWYYRKNDSHISFSEIPTRQWSYSEERGLDCDFTWS